jgi:DnaJ like chaperone protein
MSIWGKILGGAAGFALGGPLGALIGAAAGHAVDAMRRPHGEDQSRSIAFTIAIIALGAKLAKADGVVTRDEVDAFKKVFRIHDPGEIRNVGRVFDQARKDHRGYEPYAKQVARMFRDNPAVLEELLYCLAYVARADGHVHPNELDFLKKVSEIFGLDDVAFERVTSLRTPAGETDPYSVLGVRRDMSDDELKSAYRKLVRENHPDALTAQGMPEEFVQLANERLAAINHAWDVISNERAIR